MRPVHLDIGGEGRYPGAFNINPFSSAVPGSPTFARLVRSVGEELPIRSDSIDLITIENTPLRPGIGAEVARVLRSSGRVELDHPADYAADAHPKVISALQAKGAIDLLEARRDNGSVRTIITLR
jgi:hypothetical protein